MVRHLPFLEQIATAHDDEWEEIAPVFLTLRLFDDWLMSVMLLDDAPAELTEVSQAAIHLQQDLSSRKGGSVEPRIGRILRSISNGDYSAVVSIASEFSDVAREELSEKYPSLSYDIYSTMEKLRDYPVRGDALLAPASQKKYEHLREVSRTAAIYASASRAEMEGQYVKALLHYHAVYIMILEDGVRNSALAGIARCSEQLNYPALSSVATHLLSHGTAPLNYNPDAKNSGMSEEVAQVMDDLAASSFKNSM